ncbi:hypothetical protein [Massilia varians]|uniref:hypothetical protein n=1 Tax=Massilia varians TaxID=457921 RepID=UPI0025539516|nr:hypothetical protein [Massilia varians]MDK6076103.1 hypothetical protein [Massilia varians]
MNAPFSPTTQAARIVTPMSRRRPPAAMLAAMLALGAFHVPDAAAAGRKSAPPPVADFTQLTGTRAGNCTAPVESGLATLGAPTLRHCAWSQHLEMLYWQDVSASPNTCLPAPAIAWHRLGAGVGAVLRPWSAAWNGQSMLVQTGGRVQAGMVWQGEGGQWSAVLWRWRPSDRLPTRNWQAGHWNKVAEALRAIDAANPAPQRTPLMTAWLDATNGKPRLQAADSWRWVSEASCLDLRTASLGQAQMHLPYSRDDARLEQRSAMQVLLARRFPGAEWLRNFSLIEPSISGDRTGAKFLAVWRENTTVSGQLWIPLRGEGGIVRARISSELPAAPAPALQEAAKARAAVLERELSTLAHAWEARHE